MVIASFGGFAFWRNKATEARKCTQPSCHPLPFPPAVLAKRNTPFYASEINALQPGLGEVDRPGEPKTGPLAKRTDRARPRLKSNACARIWRLRRNAAPPSRGISFWRNKA